MKNIPQKSRREVADRLGEAYGNEERLQALADELNEKEYRKATNKIEQFLPGLMCYIAFPKAHQKRIRTTDGMERISKKLKRRMKNVSEHFRI